MVKLNTYRITKDIPFQMYLLSDPSLKKMLREFDFYSVRFYRDERSKEPNVLFDYPAGNLYWYVDFKKCVEELLSKDTRYETEWNSFLSKLKVTIKAEFEGLSQRVRLITPAEVVEKMNAYNLRDYQAFDLIQLCVKMKQTKVQAGLILSEQRTGKTRVAVATVLETMPEGCSVVVVCPKSAISGWVEEFDEMNRYLKTDLFNVKVYKHMREISSAEASTGTFSVKVISYDLFKRFTVAQLRKATYAGYSKVMFIGDEVHRLRNFKTLQSDTLYRFKDCCMNDGVDLAILGLTGTPAVKSSSDIFGVFSLINTSKIGFQPYIKDFNQFKEYFYNCEDTSYGKKCKTLKRTHELRFLIQTSAIQTKKRDLPMFENYTKKPIKVSLDMDEKQTEIYKSVKDTFEYGDEIDCMNGLVQLTRLQQICIDPSSLVGSYDVLAPKIRWMVGYALTKDVKTIVMAKKLKALEAVAKAFDANGVNYRILKGSTSLADRAARVSEFRTNKDVKFILIQLDVGREALTLPEATCTIFLDRDFAQGFNEQAEARMTPIDGVACTKYVIDLVMRDTVEDAIYDILVIRKESIDSVNTLNKIYEKGGEK